MYNAVGLFSFSSEIPFSLQVVDMVLEDLKKEHPDAISVVCHQCCKLNSHVSTIVCYVIFRITNEDPLIPLRQTSVVTSSLTNEFAFDGLEQLVLNTL